METHLRTELVLQALDMALEPRRTYGVIHHSDQGSQYTSLAFGQRCQQAGVRPAMGSVGDCFDNAMCESFFATLECELLERCRFKTQVEARMAVFDFIEGWYNPRRRHSALGYLSPSESERLHRDQTEQSMRSATALRTAGPPPAAASGAVQGAAVADPEPLSFSASASNRVKAEAEKLVSDQGQEDTCSNPKPMN